MVYSQLGLKGGVMLKRLLLILHLTLPLAGQPPSCTSPLYCKTKQISYMSMSQIPQTYLNASTIKSETTSSIPKCELLCMNTQGCSSININIADANTKKFVCTLLRENLYAKPNQLVKHNSFIHLYIESPCKEKPCKQGICHPDYIRNTYTCECSKETTFIATGSNCEAVTNGLESADYYWNFNKKGSDEYYRAIGKGVTLNGMFFRGNAKIRSVIVPGRSKPVAHLNNTAGKAWFTTCPTGTFPCLNSFTNCKEVTYSIWVKFTTREVLATSQEHSILFTYALLSSKGGVIGIYFSANANKIPGYQFTIVPTSNLYCRLQGFGTNVQSEKWNNFAFTYSNSTGLCAYINGEKSMCTSASVPTSASSSTNKFNIGYRYSNSRRSGLYVDDFAIWKEVLSASQVKEMYLDGAK